MKSFRKPCEDKPLKEGLQAEKDVLASFNKFRPYQEDADKLMFIKNPDPFGIDLLAMEKCDDGTYKTVSAIEVMVREHIHYSDIFVEFNKTRFCDLPQDFIIVIKKKNSSKALVLTEEKCKNLAAYEVVETNYNTKKTPEKNILVPRSEFLEYDLNTGKITVNE